MEVTVSLLEINRLQACDILIFSKKLWKLSPIKCLNEELICGTLKWKRSAIVSSLMSSQKFWYTYKMISHIMPFFGTGVIWVSLSLELKQQRSSKIKASVNLVINSS
ncbi:hypothetical protein [Paenibacillus sp. N3.4]|uniref:hypothetical protein n=1 Tax=Paenibacillus sp. N3.4 TaxID=2603222 RepID=UPI0021C4A052|nr:hypothetical protein [Paenibacillus sp. N3.4]